MIESSEECTICPVVSDPFWVSQPCTCAHLANNHRAHHPHECKECDECAGYETDGLNRIDYMCNPHVTGRALNPNPHNWESYVATEKGRPSDIDLFFCRGYIMDPQEIFKAKLALVKLSNGIKT